MSVEERGILSNNDLVLREKAFKKMLNNYEGEREDRNHLEAIKNILLLKDSTISLVFYLSMLLLANILLFDVGYFNIELFLQNEFTINSVLSVGLMLIMSAMLMEEVFACKVFLSLLFLEYVNDFGVITYIFDNKTVISESELISYAGLSVFVLLLYLILTTIFMFIVSDTYNSLKRGNFKTYLNWSEYENVLADKKFHELNNSEDIMAYALYSTIYHYERIKEMGELERLSKNLTERELASLDFLKEDYKKYKPNLEYNRARKMLIENECLLKEEERKELIEAMESRGAYNKIEYKPKKRAMRA